MAKTIVGTTMGERRKYSTAPRPRKRPRTTPSAPSVPSTVEEIITTMATRRLSQAASVHCRDEKKFPYHRVDQARGGKSMYAEALNDVGMMMRIGRIR